MSNGGGVSAVPLTRTGPPKDVKGETAKSYVTRMASSIPLCPPILTGFFREEPKEWLVTFILSGVFLMIRRFTFLSVFLLLLLVVPALGVVIGPQVAVSSYQIDPPVHMMGDTGMVTVNVMNSGPDSEYINSARLSGGAGVTVIQSPGPDPGRDCPRQCRDVRVPGQGPGIRRARPPQVDPRLQGRRGLHIQHPRGGGVLDPGGFPS